MRRSVDFPAPERPITPTIWPEGTSNETLSTAIRFPKALVSPSILSIEPPSTAIERKYSSGGAGPEKCAYCRRDEQSSQDRRDDTIGRSLGLDPAVSRKGHEPARPAAIAAVVQVI